MNKIWGEVIIGKLIKNELQKNYLVKMKEKSLKNKQFLWKINMEKLQKNDSKWP